MVPTCVAMHTVPTVNSVNKIQIFINTINNEYLNSEACSNDFLMLEHKHVMEILIVGMRNLKVFFTNGHRIRALWVWHCSLLYVA